MEKYNDLLEKIGSLKVIELAELVKAMEEKFGISAAVPVAAGGGGGGGGRGSGGGKGQTCRPSRLAVRPAR